MTDAQHLIRLDQWVPYHVYYEDTDFSGYVYHANYLKFFERSREHLIGIDFLKSSFKEGLHFVVSKAEISFLKPAQHGDMMWVETTTTVSRSPVVEFEHKAYLRPGEILVSANIKAVLIGKNGKPVKMPEPFLEYFTERAHALTTKSLQPFREVHYD
ncbi:MAG: YbgC/FadM family acyl-CoA thioesterase [Oligoflexales bacterium]